MSDLTDNMFWDRRWDIIKRGKTFMLSHREFQNLLIKTTFSIPKGGSILELGGAPGTMALRIKRIRPDVSIDIVDFSDIGVGKARKIYKHYNIKGNIIKSDFRSYIEGFRSYDFVCSFGLIEHFDDYSKVINSHFQFAKENGTIFFTIPNYSNPVVRSLLNLFSDETVATHNFECMDLNNLKGCVSVAGGLVIGAGSFGAVEFPHKSVNRNILGQLYKLMAQLANMFNSILFIVSMDRLAIRIWNSQLYVIARKLSEGISSIRNT